MKLFKKILFAIVSGITVVVLVHCLPTNVKDLILLFILGMFAGEFYRNNFEVEK